MRYFREVSTVHLAIAVVLCFLSSESAEGQQTKNGFKGVEWGTHITKMPSRILSKPAEKFDSANHEGYASLSGDIDSLGGVEISSSYFDFFDGKFYRCRIEPKGLYHEDKFKRVLIAVYGEPTSSGLDSTSVIYVNSGRKSHVTYKCILLEWDEDSTYRSFELEKMSKVNNRPYEHTGMCGNLVMYSKEIRKEVDTYFDALSVSRLKADSVAIEKAKDDF